MYKHILVPTDGSALSRKAAREAASLAKIVGAQLTAVYVTKPWIPPMISEGAMMSRMDTIQSEYKKVQDAQASKALGDIEATTREGGLTCVKLHVTDNQPWDGIITAATEKGCDLIVMASHGRKGLAGLLLGSETVKVLTHSKVPVLVCR